MSTTTSGSGLTVSLSTPKKVGEMAQPTRNKGVDDLSSSPGSYMVGRRELVPASSSLTSMCAMWHTPMCVKNAHAHNKCNKNLSK